MNETAHVGANKFGRMQYAPATATSFLPYFNNKTTSVAPKATTGNNLITSLNKVMRLRNNENPVATEVVQLKNEVKMRSDAARYCEECNDEAIHEKESNDWIASPQAVRKDEVSVLRKIYP
jgi:hypothetical protein